MLNAGEKKKTDTLRPIYYQVCSSLASRKASESQSYIVNHPLQKSERKLEALTLGHSSRVPGSSRIYAGRSSLRIRLDLAEIHTTNSQDGE